MRGRRSDDLVAVVGIICMTIIALCAVAITIYAIHTAGYKHDLKAWNSGVCSCGHELNSAVTIYDKNDGFTYQYKCDDCENILNLSYKFQNKN